MKEVRRVNCNLVFLVEVFSLEDALAFFLPRDCAHQTRYSLVKVSQLPQARRRPLSVILSSVPVDQKGAVLSFEEIAAK